MTRFSTFAVLAATLSFAMPVIAQAAPTAAQQDRLVQKINNAYGTQFPVHPHAVNAATSSHQTQAGA